MCVGTSTLERKHERPRAFSAQTAYNLAAVTMQKTALLTKYFGLFQLGHGLRTSELDATGTVHREKTRETKSFFALFALRKSTVP